MLEDVKQVIGDALQLGERTASLDEHTQLLGSIPELDSMAVVVVITALEDHFGFVVEDDEISADTFATVGTLWSFVDQKLKS